MNDSNRTEATLFSCHFFYPKRVRHFIFPAFLGRARIRVSFQNKYFDISVRRVATCKPGKPGLTSFSETLALFFIQFLSFRKMKVQGRQNGPSKSFRAFLKKLAG